MKTNNANEAIAHQIRPLKIGIVGDIRYENKRKIQETLFKLKNKYKNLEIYTGGRKDGAEKYVKKYALYFGLNYHEYTSEKTLQSICRIRGNPFTNVFQKNKIMASNIDAAIIFQHKNTDYDILHFINCMNKMKKHLIILE